MNAPTKAAEVLPQTIEFKLDGNTLHAYEGETILKAAKRHGIDIPHLCYKDGYRADGNCRACVVEVKGERVLAPSCQQRTRPQKPEDGGRNAAVGHAGWGLQMERKRRIPATR